ARDANAIRGRHDGVSRYRVASLDASAMSRSRRMTLLSVLAFVAMAAVVTWRTWHNVNVPGRVDLPLYGLHDFRDVLYYPARAMLDGRNPFAAETYVPAYPVARPLAPY